MQWRYVGWGVASLVFLAVVGFAAWVMSLPAAAAAAAAPAMDRQEADATLAALKPPTGARPVIAIVGLNDATETTDYVMPVGILRRADIADVMMLATDPGPVSLYPALAVEPDATIAAFDRQHPKGADYVIVPAMSRDDDPRVMEWLDSQAAKGAVIVGVCAGAKVVAASGLLDGRRATTHWYYVKEMLDKHPSIQYVADRRLVVDRHMATTTGITASMPMMLTLIEAIGGREKAEAVAAKLGVTQWDARHASSAFTLTRPFALTVLANTFAFWNREQLGMELRPGVDEVSLALVADAWSRTYRSRAFTFAATPEAVETRHGIRVLPDRVSTEWPADHRLPTLQGTRPSDALNTALGAIANRYGRATSDVVAMQLEYAEPSTEAPR
jgi:putative intracellular protease/amidase